MSRIVPVVAACIMHPVRGDVLLVKRFSDNPETNDRWEFPGGAIEIEIDGIPERAVEREIMEELGVRVFVSDIVFAKINKYKYSPNYFLVLFYKCILNENETIWNDDKKVWVKKEDVYMYAPLPGAVEAAKRL